MPDFSGERIFKNIKTIAKQKGIKLKDLEADVGTYPGYCTGNMIRLSNKDYKTGSGRKNLDMEIIWRFSSALGVTINDLIEGEF